LDFAARLGFHRPGMDASRAPDGRRTQLGRIAATAICYYLGARLGGLLVVPGSNVGVFWPPAGVALALVLLWGPRTWPGIALGALAALLPQQVAEHGARMGVAVALAETVADVVPTLLAARWVRRALGEADPLSGTVPALKLVLLGGLLGQGVAAAMGVAATWLAADVPPGLLPSVGVNWWLSNTVSVCVLTPLLLAWRPPWPVRRPPRHLAVYAAILAAGLLAFLAIDPALQIYLRYVTILYVIAAAFTLGARGATAATTLLCVLAIWSVATGREVVSLITVDRQLLLLNFYMATLALTGLVVALVLEDRRRGALELSDREGLLRAVLDALPLPIAWADQAGRMEHWSARAEAVFGWSLREVPTVADWFRLAYPDPAYRARLARRWEARAEEARRSGHDIAGNEVQVTCKDGTVRTVDIVAHFAGDRVVTVYSDVTARKRAEAQREELREQLAQAQRMESVGRLAGGVAHDLNNMLSPVLALTDLMLLEAPPESGQAADLAQVKRAAERARDLTKQLLAFGRKQVLTLKVVDLVEALRQLERLLRRTIREDVRIEVVIPERVGRVRADAGHIEQVVMNLAVNAQHAMPRGGTLTISAADVAEAEGAARGLAAGAWVRLTVADTGSGMEREVLDRIFEPFFTTKGEGEGTGLGLAIVHGIVTQHGGQVRAESQAGRGSAFHIYLPRVGDDVPAVTPLPGSLRAARTSATILVAEDEEAVRHTVVRLLERMGCRVLTARDAAACRRLVAETAGPIDLLVTDVVMPDLNGRQLHEALLSLRPGLPVLFMSGYAGDVVTQHGVLEDGLDFIQKPFASEDFEAAVRRALGRAAAARPGPAPSGA
jgi:PAS domain S-box-containing protein